MRTAIRLATRRAEAMLGAERRRRMEETAAKIEKVLADMSRTAGQIAALVAQDAEEEEATL